MEDMTPQFGVIVDRTRSFARREKTYVSQENNEFTHVVSITSILFLLVRFFFSNRVNREVLILESTHYEEKRFFLFNTW